MRDFRGRPMLTYPIAAARATRLFKLIVVSTDDDEIEQVALGAGAVVVRRPPDDGQLGTQEVAADVLTQFESASIACVIYATSPLLTPELLAHGLMRLGGKSFAMSVDLSGCDAGCFYWGRASAFIQGVALDDVRTTARVVLPDRHVCDINTEADWARAESMYDALRRAP